MEIQEPKKKNPCKDCNFCQCCSESRCAMCRLPSKKKKPKACKSKEHKPLFLKF